MKFTKMQGAGNDYIYVDCLERALPDPAALARRLSDRHFGIGGDGLILICPSEVADFRMRMFNADGSESEMCGNGIRCFAKFVYDKGRTKKTTISVETGGGIKTVELKLQNGAPTAATVDMGEPILEGRRIPVALDKPRVVDEPIQVDGREFRFTAVSMGNPHCIVFVPELTDAMVHGLGPKFEHHPLFPKRVNTEFARVLSRSEVEMRVWERGSGETLACGTGASAVVVAGALNGLTERDSVVRVLGGDLRIEWRKDNHVFMTGAAETVFEGEVDI